MDHKVGINKYVTLNFICASYYHQIVKYDIICYAFKIIMDYNVGINKNCTFNFISAGYYYHNFVKL